MTIFAMKLKKSRNKRVVIKIDNTNMLEIDEAKHLVQSSKCHVKISDIKIARFEKGSTKALVKLSYDSPQFTEIEVIAPGFVEEIQVRKNLASNGS